ncbi:protein shisa-5-like [Cyclopterus lumpus]|uniref:protein shisa-5-like n=1 Tax=Cyclopterus lumpus TaxID=8103 RepID=UPI001486017D|nr:protein shisa-5-like [Cyclopterus lumpus]
MAPGVLSGRVYVLCLILLPAVWADNCSDYEGSNGYHHQDQQCGSQYCCGNCERKYCCSNKTQRLSQEEEHKCSGSSSDLGTKSLFAKRLGSVIGRILPFMLIICCVAPCCFFFKKCRIGRNQSPQIVMTSYTPAVHNLPEQSLSLYGYQPAYRGYQLVPSQPGYGPPPYMETNAFTAGIPIVSFPGQPYAPPPVSTDVLQPRLCATVDS